MKSINGRSWHFRYVSFVFQGLRGKVRVSLCEYFWKCVLSIPAGFVVGIVFALSACIAYSCIGVEYVCRKSYRYIFPEKEITLGKYDKPSGFWSLVADYFRSAHRKVCPLYKINYRHE